MTKEVFEGVKEFARTVLMAIVSFALTEGVVQALVMYFYGTVIPVEIRLIVTGFITSILSGIDKWLHKKDIGVMGNGLTGI